MTSTTRSNLLELGLILAAVLAAAFFGSLDGDNIGGQELRRTTHGMTAGAAVAAVVAVYKIYRT